jgi:hypothetical protein
MGRKKGFSGRTRKSSVTWLTGRPATNRSIIPPVSARKIP